MSEQIIDLDTGVNFYSYLFVVFEYTIDVDPETGLSFLDPMYRNILRTAKMFPSDVGLDYLTMEELKEILELEVKRRNNTENIINRLGIRLASSLDEDTLTDIVTKTFNEDILNELKNTFDDKTKEEIDKSKFDFSKKEN